MAKTNKRSWCHSICGHPQNHRAPSGPSAQPHKLFCRGLTTWAVHQTTIVAYMGFGFDADCWSAERIRHHTLRSVNKLAVKMDNDNMLHCADEGRTIILGFTDHGQSCSEPSSHWMQTRGQIFSPGSIYDKKGVVQDDELVTRQNFVWEAQIQEASVDAKRCQGRLWRVAWTHTWDTWMEFADDAKPISLGSHHHFAAAAIGHIEKPRRSRCSIGHRAGVWNTHSGNAIQGLVVSEIRFAKARAKTRGPSSDHHRDRVEVVMIENSPPASLVAFSTMARSSNHWPRDNLTTLMAPRPIGSKKPCARKPRTCLLRSRAADGSSWWLLGH